MKPTWTLDYARRITPDDVTSMLGHKPTSRADYLRTRTLLAERDRAAQHSAITSILLGTESASPLIQRLVLSEYLERSLTDV